MGLRHALLLFVLALAGLAGPVACRAVVAGDAIDVGQALCDQLESCYGAAFSCEELTRELEEGADATTTFLQSFDVIDCTSTCPGTIACLDTAPFCETGACGPANPCCGSRDGLAACEGQGGSGQTTCCATLGAPCDEAGGGLACCGGERCHIGVCGGRPCSKPGEACTFPDDCCTGLCADQICAKRDCSTAGKACQTVDDCCRPEDQGFPPGTTIACEANVCVPHPPSCSNDKEPCGMSLGLVCCPGLLCAEDELAGDFCDAPTCVDKGFPCEQDGLPCCGNTSCQSGTCTGVMGCLDEGSSCGSDSECCGGWCDLSFSLCRTPACAAKPCHDLCEEGNPMNALSCDSSPSDDCVEAIVSFDSICECQEWDFYCVDHVTITCGLPCPL